MVSCSKDDTYLQPKDSKETEFLAAESLDFSGSAVPVSTQKKKSWIVPLSGANEFPNSVTTTMVGEARINLYKNGTIYWYTFNVLLMKVPTGRVIVAAHIHEATAGANGPVRFQLLKTSAPAVGSLASFGIKGQRVFITQAQFMDLLNGVKPYYVNVHTNVFPTGEVRGQL